MVCARIISWPGTLGIQWLIFHSSYNLFLNKPRFLERFEGEIDIDDEGKDIYNPTTTISSGYYKRKERKPLMKDRIRKKCQRAVRKNSQSDTVWNRKRKDSIKELHLRTKSYSANEGEIPELMLDS